VVVSKPQVNGASVSVQTVVQAVPGEVARWTATEARSLCTSLAVASRVTRPRRGVPGLTIVTVGAVLSTVIVVIAE
jgi:hypothetical protein